MADTKKAKKTTETKVNENKFAVIKIAGSQLKVSEGKEYEVKKLEGDERKQWGWRGTPVFYGNGVEKWDGGWMVLCEGLSSKIDSDIVRWRACR